MESTRKLSAPEAAARLGLQRASLYAYVSRGILSRTVAADGKSSLFDAAEVERLARRPRRGRPSLGTVDVLLSTSLTRISDEGVWYRDRPVAGLLDSWTFEQTALWLWHGIDPIDERWVMPPVDDRPGSSPAVVMLRALVEVGDDPDLTVVGRRAIARFATAVPRAGRLRKPADGRVAARVAARLGRPDLTETFDDILILLADHELASSTLAVRVAASTRAGGIGVLAAGLGTLCGPLHGGASEEVYGLLSAASREGVEPALDALVERGERVPGFGHAVYRSIDPRAAVLLERVSVSALATEMQQSMALRYPGLCLNIDFVLGALLFEQRLPPDTAQYLFGIARTAGWIAHAIEEFSERPVRFRPRSVYVRST